MLEAIRNILSPEELEQIEGLETADGAPVSYSTEPEQLRSGRLQEPVETPEPEAKVVRYYQENSGKHWYRENGRIVAKHGYAIKLTPPEELAAKGITPRTDRSINPAVWKEAGWTATCVTE